MFPLAPMTATRMRLRVPGGWSRGTGHGQYPGRAAADGTIWFTLTTKGSVATIDDAGVIREGKAVKGSQPFGVTVDAQGDPWYAMMSADKIGELQLR